MGLCPAEEPYSLETRLRECGEKRGKKGLKAVMQSIDVVAATCIGCGMGPLDSLTFPFIVIDEAAQVIEPAVLLPLGKGAVQAVMVGDQCQLPATVLSQERKVQASTFPCLTDFSQWAWNTRSSPVSTGCIRQSAPSPHGASTAVS